MLLGFLLLFGTPWTAPPQEVNFSGRWERDEERSDDPQEKMQAAMEQMREQMGRGPGGTAPPGGMPGGGRRGPGGREGRGGPPEFANVPDQIQVEMEGGELHVDDGERVRIYYLDGEKHRRQMPNGTELETVSELRGNAVVIEEKMDRGRIDRKYELSPDGETMIVTTSVELPRMKDPVVIKTVYERAGDAG